MLQPRFQFIPYDYGRFLETKCSVNGRSFLMSCVYWLRGGCLFYSALGTPFDSLWILIAADMCILLCHLTSIPFANVRAKEVVGYVYTHAIYPGKSQIRIKIYLVKLKYMLTRVKVRS